MLSIDRISTVAGFSALRDEWNRLLLRSGSDSIHLNHAWLDCWAATTGKGSEICVLRISEGGETIAFAAFMFNTIRVKRLLPYRQLLWLGDPWIDFGDVICLRDREVVLDAIFRHLNEHEEWGELLLHGVPDISPNFSALQDVVAAQAGAAEWKIDSPCYHIPMKGRTWDEFWPTTNKNFVRKDIVRLGNHYKDHDWSVAAFGASELPDHLPTLGALHESSQERKGRSSFYADPGFRQFIVRLCNDREAREWVRGYLLRIDGRSAAYVLGFEYHRIFYYWNIGFDAGFAKLSPSKFLLYHMLREGFEEGRWDEFNFMRGATDYKRRWTGDSYDLHQLRLLNSRGIYGAMNRLRRTASAPAPAP